jgi:hypothetical protein
MWFCGWYRKSFQLDSSYNNILPQKYLETKCNTYSSMGHLEADVAHPGLNMLLSLSPL